jgi:phage-related protein
MRSIKFNQIDTFEDWGLLLNPRDIIKPEPKTNYVDIPGGDGSLDLSEANTGEIKYKDFTLPFDFTMVEPIDNWDNKMSEISNFLHGRNMKIVQSCDPDYYYYGRCKVDKFSSSKALGTFSIKCTVGPYKLKHKKTVVTVSLEEGNTKTVNIKNDRMSVIPKITCTSETIITFNGKNFSLSVGSHTLLDIQFVEGMNEVKLNGSGTVTFEFQEGSL